MKTLRWISLICASLLLNFPASAANPVLEWNLQVVAALKSEATPPLLVARILAVLHLSMQEALDADGSEAGVIGAAYTAAVSLMPSHRGAFEKLRSAELKKFSDAHSTSAYQAGCKSAEKILEMRKDDGCSMQVSYVPEFSPGQWRRTPPFMRPPELVQWASKVQPFVLKMPNQFRPDAPPALSSPEYAIALNEVKNLGGKNSKIRTDEQVEIANFWSDFSYTETPPGHWNSIARTLAAQRKLSLKECAQLFALLNVAMVDSGIACWDAKYHYNAWRPVTAIPQAADDGNAETLAESNWMPLLNTPAHPEYPSGHSVFSGAAAAVLEKTLGGDKIEFSVQSDALPGKNRKFMSLVACAKECGESRILAGIHFRFACEVGLDLGKKVGEEVLRKMK